MALLSPRSTAALLCASLSTISSCGGSESLGKVDVYARDCGERACDAAPVTSNAGGRHFITQAFIDPDASRYAPHGLYVYFELEHPDGTLGTVEFDVPTDRTQAVDDYQARYRELSSDATVRFEATDMQGTIAPPPSAFERDDACACLQGGFALRFTSPGADGTLGTSDDAQRELLHGRLGSEEGWCAPVGAIDMGDGLHVMPAACAVASTSSAPRSSTAAPSYVGRSNDGRATTSVTVDAQSGVWVVPDDESGCGSGRTYRDGESEGGDCSSSDGPTSSSATSRTSRASDSSDDASAACEGDRYDDSSSNSGCQDDPDDHQAAACRIGAAAAEKPEPHRRSSGGAFTGIGLPLLLCYVALALRTRHTRRSLLPSRG